MALKLLLLFLAVLFAALFASMFLHALARQRSEEREWPFASQVPLSHVEQILFHRLVQTLPDLVVLAQVPLTCFLRVKMGQPWREWHTRIGPQSIDFLICDRDFAIIAAVDLDDRSQDAAARQKADVTKNRALAAAHVPLVRWQASALPDAQTIRAAIDEIRRERFGDVGALVSPPVEPHPLTSRIDASNDPTMFQQETQK